MEQKVFQEATGNSSARQPVQQAVKQIAGYLLALACLIWVFHDIQLHRVWVNISSMNWLLVAGAVGCDIVSYVCQGLRWQLLLHRTGPTTTMRAVQAIYAGLFTNEILPMRVGELVRTYLISRWLSVPFISIIPSVAVERLFDGIWLGIGFVITAVFIQVPENITDAAQTVGVGALVLIGLFLYLIVVRRKTNDAVIKQNHDRGWQPLRLLKSFFVHIADEIQVLGTSRYFYFSFLVSSLMLILQILAFCLIMWAYGLRLSVWAGAAVLLFLRLGTVLPNAPSNIGTYQFLCVVGLTFFGIEKTVATGFSVAVFIILTVPLWALGFVAISRSGMTLKQIRTDIRVMMKKY